MRPCRAFRPVQRYNCRYAATDRMHHRLCVLAFSGHRRTQRQLHCRVRRYGLSFRPVLLRRNVRVGQRIREAEVVAAGRCCIRTRKRRLYFAANRICGFCYRVRDLLAVKVVLRQIAPLIRPCCRFIRIYCAVKRHCRRTRAYSIRCLCSAVPILHCRADTQLYCRVLWYTLTCRPVLLRLDTFGFVVINEAGYAIRSYLISTLARRHGNGDNVVRVNTITTAGPGQSGAIGGRAFGDGVGAGRQVGHFYGIGVGSRIDGHFGFRINPVRCGDTIGKGDGHRFACCCRNWPHNRERIRAVRQLLVRIRRRCVVHLHGLLDLQTTVAGLGVGDNQRIILAGPDNAFVVV